MANCYVCSCILDEKNTTEEHIFLNAIGGHLKSKNLICKECNSHFGNEIDTALANQLNFIANMFNIKRDRGKPQSFDAVHTSDGSIYSIAPGGKPFRKKPICLEKNNIYHVSVANRQQAKEVLKGLKRKHPEIDTDTILNSATIHKSYLDNELGFNIAFGGAQAFRSLCKTAVNFYLYKGGFSLNIHHLISYIQVGIESNPVVNYLYLDKSPIFSNSKEVLHSIIVRGNSTEKILFAYIELFDFFKVVVMLNDNYEGESIEYSYFFDVISRTEVSREYELPLSKIDIENALIKKISFKDITNKFIPQLNAVIHKALTKQNLEYISLLVDIAMKKALEKIKLHNLSIEETSEIFINELMNQLTPLILHCLKENS